MNHLKIPTRLMAREGRDVATNLASLRLCVRFRNHAGLFAIEAAAGDLYRAGDVADGK